MAQQNKAAGKSVKLFITCVKGEGKYLKFWAVPEQSRKVLDKIERILEEKYAKFETSSNHIRSSQLQCGNNVSVKSEITARWCRARVQNVPSQRSVTVKLLDYGREENVLIDNVRAFDERLTEHPPLAVECILGDVLPLYGTEWTSDAIEFCQDHMLNQTMCGFVITELGKIPLVRLAKLGDNEPFVQLLINQGLANIEQYEQPRPVTFPKAAGGHSPYRSVPLDASAPHLVKISYVDSPERFFVQLSAAELELNNLMTAIDKHVSAERLSPLETPAVYTPCLSPLNCGGSGRRYFRSLITAVEPRTCKVFLVDYGRTETKEYNELKVLPLNFLNLPIQALQCSLPPGLNVTKETLISATAGQHLYCHVLSFNGSSYVVRLSHNNCDLFMVSDTGFSFYNIMHLNLHSTEEVLISYVCSACEFFCQLEKNYAHIKSIQGQLNGDNGLQPASFVDCIPGAPVCVRFSEDCVWYRAKVLHAENPNSIKVTFVDYGNSETTSLPNIKRLSQELAKIPMQALKCTLSGLESLADPSSGIEIFQELIEDKKLTVEVLSSSRETGYIVNLYDMSDPSVTVNTKIKQRLLGVQQITRIKPGIPEVQNNRPKQQFSMEACIPPPTVERVEKLYISSFTSASLFFGQFNKIDETKLDEMQGEINELYSATGRSKFTASVGDIVCAKFSEDGNFYRAKVEECAGDSCKVHFIDFGNRETVDVGDVHKIRQTFMALPQFGIECALQSCPSADSVQQLKDIMEENVFEFNMLSEKNGKWIVSLTEDFMSNAPVLEFLRQNEAPTPYINQGTKQTEDSEVDVVGDSSDMNDRRRYHGDGGGRRDSSRSYTNTNRQNRQEYFADRQRNVPSRNFGDNVDGTFRNYGERSGGAAKNFGGRADIPRNYGDRTDGPVQTFGVRTDGPVQTFGVRTDGPKKNFGDRTDGPKKNFGDRTDSPKKNFGDRTDGPKKNFGDRSDGPKKNFGDRTDGPVHNFSGRTDATKKTFGDRSEVPPKNFGDRAHNPKKSFVDGSNNPPRNFENSGWNDVPQRFGSKKSYSDNSTTRSSSFDVSESPRASTQDSVTESPKLTDYSNVIINNGTYREVYVSHIVNPSEFYCQTTEEKLKMPVMMEKISHKYIAMNDNEQILNNAFVGQPCCAIYSEDGCWYRGRVTGMDHPSRPSFYDVFFVDYGNVEKVPASKVKCLDSEFFSYPPLALKCALFNILPKSGSWSQDDVKKFMDIALDKCFVAKFEQIDASGTHLVNLLDINKLQNDIINQDLMISGHGRLADANKMLVINSQVASTNLSFAEPDVQEGTTEEVIVTWVLNPVEFYCQLQSFMPVFTKMMKDLQAYYGKTTDIDHVVDRPQPGMICVAQFSEDNAWYRAKVISVEKNHVDVYYVDYGNSEQVTRKKVKYIHQDFTIHPVQGIRCQLEGIRLSGEASISKSAGQKYFGGRTICSFVKKGDGFFYVTLLNDSKNVADELLHSDVVLPDSQSTVSAPQVSVSVKCCIPEKQLDMSPGTLLSVTVPFITSPKQFWCCLSDSADQLEDLMGLIDARYNSTNTKPLTDIKTGCGCVAQYSEDNRWYRAVIKDFNKEMDSCEVFFVDYGNTETVRSSEVKLIEPEFCSLPAQAIECQLYGIPDAGSSEATTKFMKVLESEELLAKVELVDNEVLVVTLLDCSGEDEVNIAESIFGPISESQGVETEVPVFSKPTIRTGVQNAYISYVNDPSDFYVQLEETEEELSDYAAALSEQYECIPETDFIVQDARVGMACCAKFTDDNQWYRAEIIDITDSSATVLFVDYGNTDVVQVHSLKKLTEDLLKKPPYAIHCTLTAVKPLNGNIWSAEAITVFEQTTSDTLLTIKFESQELPVPVTLIKDEEEDVAKQLANLQLCCYDKMEVQGSDNAPKSISFHPDIDTHGISDVALDFKPTCYTERVCDARCTVKLSYAYSLDKFFVTPVDLLEQLETVTEKLQELYNTDEEIDTSLIAVTQPCVARYTEDMVWYRALITDIQGDAITVLFVDFGNTEVIEASHLKPLKYELLEIPPFAIECSLFDVTSVPGNQEEISAKLEDFIENEAEFEMEIIEGHQPHKVKLKGQKDLAEQLVEEGLAEYVHLVVGDSSERSAKVSPSPAVTLEEEQAPTGTSIQDIAENDKCAMDTLLAADQAPIQISVQNISIGKLIVDVEHVEVLNNLIVLHVVPSHQKAALTDLQLRLNETYGQSENHPPCSPSSTFCVAKSPEDNCWYRAEILNTVEENCYVRFVDFGNCESVPTESVADLLPEFSNEHQFSISCCMFGIKVVEGSEGDVKTRIFDIIGENCCTLKISCNVPGAFGMCWGLLVALESNLSVMQVLVEEGLACHLCPPVQLPGDEFDAEIKSVETDNDLLLYVIPTLWIEEREQFHKDLQEACSLSGDFSFDVNSDLVCAVLLHNEWNRGYIISSIQEEVVVYLIDCGFTKTVSPSSLKPLPPEFCQKAPLILRCALHNWVFPLTDTIRDKFYEMCMSKTAKCKLKYCLWAFEPFYISLNIEDSDVFSCMLQYVDEESNVAGLREALEASQEDGEYSSLDNFKECITEHFEVADDSGYPNEDVHFGDARAQNGFKPSVEDQHQPAVAVTENVEGMQKYPERSISNKCAVKLSFVYSSDKFYVTPVELQDQLDYITSVLKEQYDLTCESDEQPLCQPCNMQPCVTQYADDLAWYRALITDTKDDEVSVLFIDFGNTEVVKCDSLRVITSELLKIAPVAVECSLFGIQVIPGKQEEVNSRLMSLLENEVELEMEVTESHELPYRVKLKNDVDISEQFVNDELCEYYVTPSQKLQDSETFKENLRIVFLEEPLSLEENKGIISQQNLSLGKMFIDVKYVELSNDVIVLHVVPESLKDALINLQEKLQSVYCNSVSSSLQTSSKFCAAKSSDEVWYRAQLLEQSDEGYSVKFIDYGKCEIIPFTDVRELLPEFIAEIQYSVACCLSGVKIIPGNEGAIEEKIYDLISQTETAIEICDVELGTTGLCRAALKVDIDSNDVSNILVEDGLVLQIYPTPYLPGTSFQVCIEEIASNEQLLFYVIPTEWVEARRICQQELLKTCEFGEPLAPCDICSNRLYAAMFDKQWYRASVVTINEDSVVVNLVDYGKCKSVDKDLLQYLEPKFCHKPPFVLQCMLSGWQTVVSCIVCEKFAEFCHGKTVTCKVVEPSSRNSEPFTVSIEIDGEDVFLSLTELVGRSTVSETESTSVTTSGIFQEKVDSSESSEQVSSNVVRVAEDTESDPHNNSEEIVGDSGNENIPHTEGRNLDSSGSFEGAEYESPGTGQFEEEELSSGVSQQKDFSKSQVVEESSDFFERSPSRQASELAINLCDAVNVANTQVKGDGNCVITTTEDNLPCVSAFNESASPAVALTNDEVEEGSSVCSGPVKDTETDSLFQDSSVGQTAGSSEVTVKNLNNNSVFTGGSSSSDESSPRNPVEDDCSSSCAMQSNQNAVINDLHDATNCKNVKDLCTVVNVSEEQELCTPNTATLLTGNEHDEPSSSVPLSSSASSQSNIESVSKMQADNSEDMDRVHKEAMPLCSDSNNTCEKTE